MLDGGFEDSLYELNDAKTCVVVSIHTGYYLWQRTTHSHGDYYYLSPPRLQKGRYVLHSARKNACVLKWPSLGDRKRQERIYCGYDAGP